jgi:uncharacterized membrane protein YfcA
MEYLWILVLMLGIGGVAGIVAGMLGVGGGIVLVPAFFYAFEALGYGGPKLMQICVASSLATIGVTSVRSVLGHNKKGAVDWQILRGWGPGIALGAIVGVVAAAGLKSNTLMLVFGVLGLLVGLYMAFGRSHWRLGDEMPGVLGRSIASPALGFLSVLMGIGGGSFGVPMMTLYGRPIHRAVATAAGFGVLIAVPSMIGFMLTGWDVPDKPPLTLGYVNLIAFGVIVSMTMLTTPIGVRLAHAMNPRPLKLAFAIFIAVMAANMLRKGLGF